LGSRPKSKMDIKDNTVIIKNQLTISWLCKCLNIKGTKKIRAELLEVKFNQVVNVGESNSLSVLINLFVAIEKFSVITV
jgi:hypothetical protein